MLLRDLLLWAVIGGLVALESVTRGEAWWMTVGAVIALGAAVLLRRTRPLAALAVASALMLSWLLQAIATTDGVPIAYVPAISYFAFLAGRRAERARAFARLVAGAMVLFFVAAVVVRTDLTIAEIILNWFMLTLVTLLFVVLPWFIGRYRAQSALLVSAGWERAERIEREQRMRVDEARLRERSRIAEDMHDSVGHELSLIALRAGALEVDAELSERHRTAATELRLAAAAATERLGEIIGVLRESDGDAPLAPSHESIAELVDNAAASGLAVRLVETHAAEPSPMVDRAAHRVVQEGLTNATKHAPGAEVTVSVVREEASVEIRIRNGPPTRAVPPDVASGGRGLVGLTERLRLVGGTLAAVPRSDGGFEVTARMPRRGGRPETAPDPSGLSESAHELATVRRTARRGLVTAIAAPVALGMLIGIVALGYYLVIGYSSILRPAEYDALRIGQTRAEVAEKLPVTQMLDPPAQRAPAPPGAICEFYRPGGPFTTNYAYRLCFVDDRLTSKDVVRTGSVEPTIEGTPK